MLNPGKILAMWNSPLVTKWTSLARLVVEEFSDGSSLADFNDGRVTVTFTALHATVATPDGVLELEWDDGDSCWYIIDDEEE